MACPIGGKLGKDFLVRILDQGSPGDDYVYTMANATSISIDSELVDATDKSQNGWRKVIPGAGLRSVTISLSGPFDSTYQESRLNQLALTNGGAEFELFDADGNIYSGCFVVTNYTKEGDATTPITWSATLESATEITYNPGSPQF